MEKKTRVKTANWMDEKQLYNNVTGMIDQWINDFVMANTERGRMERDGLVEKETDRYKRLDKAKNIL